MCEEREGTSREMKIYIYQVCVNTLRSRFQRDWDVKTDTGWVKLPAGIVENRAERGAILFTTARAAAVQISAAIYTAVLLSPPSQIPRCLGASAAPIICYGSSLSFAV